MGNCLAQTAEKKLERKCLFVCVCVPPTLLGSPEPAEVGCVPQTLH